MTSYLLDLLMALVFIGYMVYAYRWHLKHPKPVCPVCNGTGRVPNEFNHFARCRACETED